MNISVTNMLHVINECSSDQEEYIYIVDNLNESVDFSLCLIQVMMQRVVVEV